VKKRTFTASIMQEGDWYVAQRLEVDVASQRETEEEASSTWVRRSRSTSLRPSPPSCPTCDRSTSKSVLARPLAFREVKRNLEAVGFTDYGRTYRR
jgi:hypothetical protein